MATRRTIDLLPEIFRTSSNKKFLSATLDQLTQEPQVKRTQGYVGRRVGPGVNPADNYVIEPTATRANYQLEPGVVFLKPDTDQAEDAITYPGLLDSLAINGSDVRQQDRLWSSEYYAWDPFCDLDKFVNYSQYYWLPNGPESVDVSTTVIPLTDDYTVTRSTTNYSFTGQAGENPTITLVRGGNYSFEINQPGHRFWIQSAPGVTGRLPQSPNISSRDVMGVIDNGQESGTVSFYVPLKDAQSFYYTLNDIGTVDLVSDSIKFNEINNVYVDQFLQQHPSGIDGITNLNQRTVIFTNRASSAVAGGWQIITQYDPLARVDANNGLAGSFDSIPYDETVDITSQAQRYSIWRINYVNDNDGRPFMQLSSVENVANLSKFSIRFGTQWSSTSWYKNASGYFEEVPLLTAIQDTLYYQDSTNPEIFGRIVLVDQASGNPLNIDDIIGAKNYTSPNGVKFTNGLKIQFRGLTMPERYQNLEYYVEGVGSGPGIDARVGFVDGEAYFGPYYTYLSQKITGTPDSGTFQQYIYDTVEESILNRGRGTSADAPLPTTPQYGATAGNGIRLIPVREMVTPETYTESETVPYDSLGYDLASFDADLNSPLMKDYITINRGSRDRNAWSRSNRWFHIDVIRQTAELNNVSPVIDNQKRAKRPIIEFRSDLQLWNMGTQGLTPVDIIDFSQTDAFTNVNGSSGYGIDGYQLLSGSRIIFAADSDPAVRNRIYTVQFIRPDGNPNTPLQINLVTDERDVALVNQTVVCMTGLTQQGLSFWFDGVTWQNAQHKISINQPPLFNVFDNDGNSLGDRNIYPSSDFAGSRLFGYAVSTSGLVDEVLGFALEYRSINNVGDIVFKNYLYTDTFRYVNNNLGVEENISQGFVRQFIDRVTFSNEIGWQTAITENRARQVFRFTYDGSDLVLDVPINVNSVLPPLQIFVDGVFVDPTSYTYRVQGLNTIVTMVTAPAQGTIIEVQAMSPIASSIAYYNVPLNLENNAINTNSDRFTLGTIRGHYESIGQNLRALVGTINGINNTRDLGNILPYGENIVQHSSPMLLPGVFMRDMQFDMFSALKFNDQEYSKYKAQVLELAAKGDFINLTSSQILDDVIETISLAKSEQSPFYWSDMIPAGRVYTEITTAVTPITTAVFDLTKIYDFTSSNYDGLLIYLNDRLLTRKYDYVVSTDAPTVTILTTLSVGDVVRIREYNSTVGSFVPNTPTKVGLYPAYRPEIFYDESYVTPTLVIRGHDGSITVAYGDIRDNVLLEFETRIFNNLKVSEDIPLIAQEVIPGQFRPTDYSLSEVTEILSVDFLSWVGWNRLEYIRQDYQANNAFTYNYRQSGNKIDGKSLLGAWRGIYNNFYDTIYPNTRPWEMLGFSEQPTWWEDTYGPAPYTSGNLVLWEDLEAGIVRDPAGSYVRPEFVRPGLTQVIPAGSEGSLLSPLDAVVGKYDANTFRTSWTVGDDGPTESAWRTSSSWPFAIMRLLLLTKPAKFFSLGVDRDRYRYSSEIHQWLWDGRYRLDAKQITPLYGSGTSKASYINWIVDYNQQHGVDSAAKLSTRLSNLDVRLCWRVAGYTDKKYLKLYVERSTPTGTNAGLLLPDESYKVLLYKNQPFQESLYSSVIVQRTEGGWAVFGYSTLNPYFNILVSRSFGQRRQISAGGSTVTVATEYEDRISRLPYGFIFTNRAAVCDFLLSYGETLRRQGFAFQSIENGIIMDWDQMAQEFLYWSNQGWVAGSVINLNPGATKISVTRPNTVAESLIPSRPNNLILNQNRQAISGDKLIIDRYDNTFSVTTSTAETLNYLNLRLTAYEHLVILDNTSIFADLIYDPATGARQSRVRVAGIISGNWNGTVNAPGFIINEDNIQTWRSDRKYAKGEIVEFKDQLWTASTIINPSTEFNYALWLKSDITQVQQGLLPNSANASDQLATAYNVYSANLEQEVDLFAYGLIGFRPRGYMQALNLDDVSQVQLYQQFLGSKGTRPAAEIFSLANLGKETAEYRIYEYWAIQQSVYGANANRSYFEILLDEALLSSDPSVIQVINPGQESQADQTVLLADLWKESYRIPSTDILPTLDSTPTDRLLPTAGYVNLEDVDLTLFDIDTATTLTTDLQNIGVGSTVWVAKVNPYDWNVYTTRRVPAQVLQVSDNLDGLSLVTFSQAHGLALNDTVIIRFFNAAIDGVYRVRSIPSIYTILIEYTFTGNQTTLTGDGVAFTLSSVRVAQPSNLSTIQFDRPFVTGSRLWVDNDRTGNWQVLERTAPWTEQPKIDPPEATPQPLSDFGFSVAQGFFNLTSLIGAPRFTNNSGIATGAVYVYGRGASNQLEFTGVLSPSAQDTELYGYSMDVGQQTWGVIGAPGSMSNVGYAVVTYRPPTGDFITQNQLLVPYDTDQSSDMLFGYHVTVSLDERYVYIGAPAVDRVYAYARVDVQNQSVVYTTNGIINVYNWDEHIVLPTYDPPLYTSYPSQISVLLNETELEWGIDWVSENGDIVLNIVPDAGQRLTILRRNVLQLGREYYANVDPAISTTSTGSGCLFNVEVLNGAYAVTIADAGQDYAVGDTFTILGTQIGGATPANDITITVNAPVGFEYRSSLTTGIDQFQVDFSTGIEVGKTLVKIAGDGSFGGTVTVTDITGDIVTVSGPATADGFIRFYLTPGPVTTFSQSGTGILSSTFDILPYMATVDDNYSMNITVNEVQYRPFVDYSYNASTGILTFLNVPPRGSTIFVSSNTHFKYIGTLDASTTGDNYGAAVSTTTDGREIVVGAPNNDSSKGKSFVYNRGWQKFIVADTADTEFTTVEPLSPVTAVKRNGVFLVNNYLNINGDYDVDTGTQTVTITSELDVGDVIEIETNSFILTQEIVSSEPFANAQFGYQVDQCVNNCSLYISAPFDGQLVPQGGRIDYWQNQSRIYGTTTAGVANPILTPGGYLSINGQIVEGTGTTAASLATDINGAGIPNVVATVSQDLILTGDGTTKVFSIGTMYSAADSYNTVVYLGTSATSLSLLTPGSDYTYDNTAKTITFAEPPFRNAYIKVVSGRLTISIKNTAAGTPFNLLSVIPVDGTTLFDALGFHTYVHQQVILPPVNQDYARFGESLYISQDARTLAVGAPYASMIRPTTFDSGKTYWDARSTTFFDASVNSGAVYLYDFLSSYLPTVSNPGQFVFGQQITSDAARSLDRIGQSVDLTTGVLLAGAPGNDLGDSSGDFGTVLQYINNGQQPSWSTIRRQTPVVDVSLLNSGFIYDVGSSKVNTYLDYFDPLQGKLLGVVRENLNFIGAVNPAQFNVGSVNNNGQRWGAEHVGQMWWDTTNCRFIDPNQDDITYASRRWGQVFPGSQIDVYQWVSSSVPPDSYTGDGTPRSLTSYSVAALLNDQGVFEDVYYFWVKGIRTVARSQGKTLSSNTVAQYITNPRSSGIAYFAALTPNAVAVYNSHEYIGATDSVLHIEYDREATENNVHVQYHLVAQGRARDFLPDTLYRKLLDSFVGTDVRGNLVPDPFLAPSDRYGVNFRPRQSMFVNRFGALQNYLTSANTVLLTFPAAERRSSRLLNSAEQQPSATSGVWDKRVANLEELGFQDLIQVPVGYRYLVDYDSSNRGLWTIYEVQTEGVDDVRRLVLLRVQTYDTRQYWNYIDWYQAGYDRTQRILLEVPVVSDLDTLDVPVGSSVKVTANAQGKWEIYQLLSTGWDRVALQSGTLAFSSVLWDYAQGPYGFDSEVFDSQYYDQEPTIETRQIIRAINEELFVGDLLIERNNLLALVFEYITSEQISPDWLNKTSLIDVDHIIRELRPYQIYRQDNQDFVLDYIQEVKPYHTQIREFNLIYRGSDQYLGTLADFDLPATWDSQQQLFISPILDDGEIPFSTTSSVPSTSALWQQFPYNQWYQNYLLSIQSVTVIDGGSGYTVPPQVNVIGDSTRTAVMSTRINSAGQVVEIVVEDPGVGYLTTAVLVIEGGNGSGARAVAIMGNQLVRGLCTTIKYDRYQYVSDITDWTVDTAYAQGDRVRYDARVWQAPQAIPARTEFDLNEWTLIPAGDLSGVDRTMGYYVPTPDQPGLELALLISGVEYPGVQVSAPTFIQSTGFDIGNFDINPFDNISFDSAGRPTYDPAILDTIYESEFTDPYLGVNTTTGVAIPDPRPGAIEVDGGGFVDTYSSPAPEELVPGSIFDTLDMRVFTTPGSDWEGDGHGFPTATDRVLFSDTDPTVSWDGMIEYPVSLTVSNGTTGTIMTPTIDYTVDWVNRTVTMIDGITDGQYLIIDIAALGGGNQLLSRDFIGDGETDTLAIPRPTTDINQVVIFVNGQPFYNFTLESVNSYASVLVFDTPLTAAQRASITVMGYGVPTTYSWSAPLSQYWVADGSVSTILTNSMQGTNPVNLIVTRNGRRATPPAGAEYVGDGIELTYLLPDPGGYTLDLVADNDVFVYVANQALTLGLDYVVDPYDASSLARTVTLFNAPAVGAPVLISVRTGAQYFISGNVLQFRESAGFLPQSGDIVGIISWNDTAEQNILTKVFVGPATQGLVITEAYDTTPFDDGTVAFDPGSYDYSEGTSIQVNQFDLGRVITKTDRLIVSLNGTFLYDNLGYTVTGSILTISGPAISPTSEVAVTMFTDSTVPGEIAFRIFQDMRGAQTLYRITEDSTTVLTQALSATADVIHVQDASRMPEPDLSLGRFGLITINGERIAYRTRDTVLNQLSGLRRGTAGTAADSHVAGTPVYSISEGNRLPAQYQSRYDVQNFVSDGQTTEFTVTDFSLQDFDSTELVEAIQVFVGGFLQTQGVDYTFDSFYPSIVVSLTAAPEPGYQITVRVKVGEVMYHRGIGTPSDGVALQVTDTLAARFIRGQ